MTSIPMPEYPLPWEIHRPPAVYCAGKIGYNDWRRDVFHVDGGIETDPKTGEKSATATVGPCLLVHDESLGPSRDFLPCKDFLYCGPFFESLGHGAAHGGDTHGAAAQESLEWRHPWHDGGGEHGVSPAVLRARAGVSAACLAGIVRCDIFFAWLDDLTAYGTLVEIGYAKALGKRVILAAPELPFSGHLGETCGRSIELTTTTADLWFAFELADEKIIATSPKVALMRMQARLRKSAKA